MDKEEKAKTKAEREKNKEELQEKMRYAKKIEKKQMNSEQLAFYKQGSKEGRRKSFLIRSAIKCSILAGAAFGVYKGYQYLEKTYSPMVIEKTKDALDLTGGYFYNYVYYKTAYSLESGKTQAMSDVIEQMLDKFQELKQQLEVVKNQAGQNPYVSALPNYSHCSSPQKNLDANEKIASANFIASLYNNKETSKFDIQTIQWASTFNLDVKTTHENGNHQFFISLTGDESVMEGGRKVFGTEPVKFNKDMYTKFGSKGIEPAINLIKNVVSNLDSSIYSIGIDGNSITMEQLTNFFKEDDCLNYLKNAGLDLGVNTNNIEQMLNDENGLVSTETEKEQLTAQEEQLNL